MEPVLQQIDDKPMDVHDKISRIMFFSVLSITVLVVPDEANAQLKFCNKTGVPVYTAAGYPSGSDWKSKGWWRIWPGECTTVIRGELTSRYYYARAEASGNRWVWGDGPTFCTDSSRFTLKDGNCSGRGYDEEKFTKIDTKNNTSYRLSFTCTSCSLPDIDYNLWKKSIDVYHVGHSKLENKKVYTEFRGTFDFEVNNNRIVVDANIDADLGHLQKVLPGIIRNKASRNEECGDRVYIRGVDLSPNGNSAELDVRFDYERWYCTYADVPQVKCEDTYIKIGPLKTKGIPRCKTWVATTRTSKNKVFWDSGRLTVLLQAYIDGRYAIGIKARVSRAKLKGLGQALANLFRIDFKKLAQREIDEALKGESFKYAIPSDLRKYTRLKKIRFTSSRNGSLRAVASGSFTVRPDNIRGICAKFFANSLCNR